MSTPAHIVPEWYFLPFYAILRRLPDIHIPFTWIVLRVEAGGVMVMGGAIFMLACCPGWIVPRCAAPCSARGSASLFWVFVLDCIVLGLYRGETAGRAFHHHRPNCHWLIISSTFSSFCRLLSKFEKTLPLPNSIAEAVLAKPNGVAVETGKNRSRCAPCCLGAVVGLVLRPLPKRMPAAASTDGGLASRRRLRDL